MAADGAWLSLTGPVSVPPGPVVDPGGVYDPVRSQLVIFGGWNGSNARNTTWTLSLTGTPVWSQMIPAGTAPPARYAHTMVYDPVRDRMLVFGGTSNPSTLPIFGDVWALNLGPSPQWSLLATAGTTPARLGHTAVYDPVRDRMVVFGGYNGSFLNDTWALSLSGTPTWTQLATAARPTARDFLTSIYDPIADRMVIFGGNAVSGGGPVPVADSWVLPLGAAPAWSQLATTGTAPGPRLASSSLYDPVRQRMLVFGGLDAIDGRNETFALSLSGVPTWANLSPAGSLPAPRWEPAFVYDPTADRAVMFAGRNASRFFGDTWTLDLSAAPTWAEVPTPAASAPPARLAGTTAYDPAGHRMIEFGGIGGSAAQTYLSDTWALSLDGTPAWAPLDSPAGTRPPARGSHVLVRDEAGNRLVTFGGKDPAQYFNDTWQFDLASNTWSPLLPRGPLPGPRQAMAGAYDPLRQRLLIFGGVGATGTLDELWALDLGKKPSWTRFTLSGTRPAARYGHSMVYDPIQDRMLVFGGFDLAGNRFNDLWSLSLARRPQWTALAPAGTPPSARVGHQAHYDPLRRRMIVYGGYDGAFRGDVNALDLTTNPPAWDALSPAGGPPLARDFTSGAYDPVGDRFVLFGGNGLPQGVGTPAVPLADTWALAWASAPAAMPIGTDHGVVVPGGTRFGFAGALPNPVFGALVVAFELGGAGTASLDLFAVNGRRVLHHDLTALGAGTHSLRVAPPGGLAPGVYLLRLAQGEKEAVAKIAIIR